MIRIFSCFIPALMNSFFVKLLLTMTNEALFKIFFVSFFKIPNFFKDMTSVPCEETRYFILKNFDIMKAIKPGGKAQ